MLVPRLMTFLLESAFLAPAAISIQRARPARFMHAASIVDLSSVCPVLALFLALHRPYYSVTSTLTGHNAHVPGIQSVNWSVSNGARAAQTVLRSGSRTQLAAPLCTQLPTTRLHLLQLCAGCCAPPCYQGYAWRIGICVFQHLRQFQYSARAAGEVLACSKH